MTPIEYRREMAAYHERRRELDERAIAVAWFTVAIENDLRAGRMKSLGDTIEQYTTRTHDEPSKPSVSAMAAQLAGLSQRFGLPPLKPMSEETRRAMWKPRAPVQTDG